MKLPRYSIIIIMVLFFAFFSRQALATEYPGGLLQWPSQGTYTYDLNVPDAGPVSNVSLYINNAHTYQGFNNNTMILISPAGTIIYLFDMSSYPITGKSLFHTRFIETSTIMITDGIPPYAGSFRPGESFSAFIGEGMTGTWTLAVYNDGLSTSNAGAVTDWSLIINQTTPVPTAPPPVPTPGPIVSKEYIGTDFSWQSVGVTAGVIHIGNQGIITDVNLNITADCAADLASLGMYLRSPQSDNVGLFETGDLSGSSLYLTTFDDGASQSITTGLVPYLGLYRPVDSLALFNDQTMAGDWTLIIQNSNIGNPGDVTDWSLIVSCWDYSPTGTPTPTVTTTPTPSPTPSYYPPTPTPEDYCPSSLGPGFELQGQGVFWTSITAPAPSGKVGMVTLKIQEFTMLDAGDLEDVGMYLKSPVGTIVTLFPINTLTNHSLSETWFKDAATLEINEGTSPYIGSWKPRSPAHLSDFADEEIAGTWELGVYNNYYSGTDGTDWALMGDDWELEICLLPSPSPSPTPTGIIPTPTLTPVGYKTPLPPQSTPTSPPPVCQEYSGGAFSWTEGGTTTDTINITDYGEVTRLSARITASCLNGFEAIRMTLQSPSGRFVSLYNENILSGVALYDTGFDDDASTAITDVANVPPYLGSYRPQEPFSVFSGDSIKGIWTLIVYNSVAGSGEVEDWKLTVCRVPTPTPSPIRTPRPSPTLIPPQPTPILILQSGDYNGDGRSDIGVFRPATGLWSIRSVGTSWFGELGDLPASGDYDGDGTANLTVFRGLSSLWAISNVTRVYFGGSSDITIPGDYDGDGSCDIGIYRSSSGLWAIRGVTRRYFGSSGDYPVPGDYNGDGFCDFAVFRPSTGLWAVNGVTRVYFGVSGDLPIPRDYDGDGSIDIGIVRLASGLWAIRGVSRFYFGGSGDYPVPADYAGNGTAYPGIFRCSSGLWAVKGFTRVYHGGSGDIPVSR